ncbi:NAD(P)/FAD-dependent oxidoreductase [Frankia sp. Ag45/Mut15]|uniref:Ferredoxin--NADP reductase n=1 Tax=Frankia umida TaxID=573489 RepID=A0ABT0JT97_9ACTN|nr:NAD(P)/FAD-dependent oxidoreductase [Frankia umida]MCK9874790.1 NAD(P)/FAD-dependent oxidoreductase [Frankia umida]
MPVATADHAERIDVDMLDVDMLIVGAGPVGLFGAYYAGFRGMSVAVMDALPTVGGQITAMYPEKVIYDVAGFPAVRGRELIDALVAQAAPYQPEYLLGRQAMELASDPEAQAVVVTDASGGRVRARAVVVTGGIGAFAPKPLPGMAGRLGRGLSYFVPRPQEHAGRDVVVAGGSDSAVDWALALAPVARSVTLVHKREQLRAHPAALARLEASEVQVRTLTDITAVHGDDWIAQVELVDTRDGSRQTRPAQAIIAALGFATDLGPLTRWGLTVQRRRIIVGPAMVTGVERVFAAGDVVDYPGKVRLIATGFGEVATAVNNAAPIIDPNAKVFPGHSSDDGAH